MKDIVSWIVVATILLVTTVTIFATFFACWYWVCYLFWSAKP